MRTALVSIHDVMPETLDDVAELLDMAEAHAIVPVTLLVVPGRPWRTEELMVLRRWLAAGHRLAGHGWSHRAAQPCTVHHRLHALLLSRDSAEHLSLDGADIARLMRRNHDWFGRHGLPEPDLYVPPAWALGPLPRTELPYRFVETLGGVRDLHSGKRLRLPLIGFEADTGVRAGVLRAWNACAGQGEPARPVRVAIHPRDLRLRLAGDLRRVLGGIAVARGYDELPLSPEMVGRRPRRFARSRRSRADCG